MKSTWIILVAVVLAVVGIPLQQACANSQTFQVSVFIPAIPGVNVPLEGVQDQLALYSNDFGGELIVERVLRGTEEVTLRTLVLK